MATAESSKEELLELLRQAKLQVGIPEQSNAAVMSCRIDITVILLAWSSGCEARTRSCNFSTPAPDG